MPDREPGVPDAMVIEKEEVVYALRRLIAEIEAGDVTVESYYEGRSITGSDVVVVLTGRYESF